MKIILTIILLQSIVSIPAFTQIQAEIDSLLSVADTLNDDGEMVKIFRRLHELIMFSDPESARDYAIKALELSKRLEDSRGIAIGYMQIGNFFANRNENDSAFHYYHMALERFKETNSIFINLFHINALALCRK